MKCKPQLPVKSSTQICRSRFGRTVLLLCLISPSCSGFVGSQVTPEGGDLQSFIAAEEQRGSVLTYTQSYTDDENERVSYTGTLYTGIRFFKVDECQMIARVAVEDRFSGRIGHRKFGRVHFEATGELTDDTVYEYRVSLRDLSPGEIHELRAVPAEMSVHTSFRCEEDSFCNVYWVHIKVPENTIAETRTVNDIQNLDTKVASIVLPMASQESAAHGTKLFSAAIRACSTTRSDPK
jgi:hypothetical protein